MRPEGCACAGRKRDTHAPQHRDRIRSPNELTIVQQSLAGTGSPLQLVCLTRGTGTGAGAGSGLKSYRLLLNNISRHWWRLSNSGRCASSLATTAGHTTPNVVTDIKRTAEKFRRNVISLRNQIVALLAERYHRNCVRFHFDL